MLRRFVSEAETLCGLTSEDADKARAAATAAAEAARAEEAAGGVAVNTRGSGGGAAAADGAGGTLVLRGEDVATQVTHALVCLLRVRPALADTVAALGFLTKTVQCLSASSGKPARYSLYVQCVRILQVCAGSGNKACLAAAARANAVAALVRSMTPLHRDAAFTLETLKLLLEADSRDATTAHPLVEAAVRSDVITLCFNVLEKEKLDHLVDPSAAKVHAVAILKVLESDSIYGPQAAAVLTSHRESWERYRHQKHDLFLSRNDTRDYFLTDAASSAPAFMLKNSAEWAPGAGSSGHAAHGAAAGGAGAAGGALIRVPSGDLHSDGSSGGPPTLYSDSMNSPPPAPEFLPAAQLKFGSFQAPAAVEPASRPAASAGAAAAAAPAVAAPPAAADPFASWGSLGASSSASAAAPRPAAVAAPAPAPAAAAFDPFASFGAAPAPAPAAAPKPAAGGADPFADLLG